MLDTRSVAVEPLRLPRAGHREIPQPRSRGARWAWLPSVLVLSAALLLASPSAAGPVALVPAPSERATLRDKITGGVSYAELGVLLGSGAVNLTLYLLRPTFDGLDSGRLVIPSARPDSIDARIAAAAYDPSGQHLNYGIPDSLGSSIVPITFVVSYAANAAAYWISGRSLGSRISRSPPGDPLRAVRLFYGALEVVSYSGLIQQLANSFVSRQRPYVDLNHPEYARHAQDDSMSFYSGHTSMAFGIAAYASLHLGAYLADDLLARRHLATRILVGRVLPSAALYGLAAYVGASRVTDQGHYFSDVILGAVVGTALGNALYLWHFAGRSEKRQASLLFPTLNGVAFVGAF